MRTKLILVAASFLLASCGVTSWLSSFSPYKMEIRQGNLITPEMRERLRIGMSRQQVSSALGSPLLADVYHANRWDYVYRYEEKGQLVEQRRLTVFFKDNFVSSIEEGDAYGQPPATAASAVKAAGTAR